MNRTPRSIRRRLAAAWACAATLTALPGSGDARSPDYSPDRIIVRFDPQLVESERARLAPRDTLAERLARRPGVAALHRELRVKRMRALFRGGMAGPGLERGTAERVFSGWRDEFFVVELEGDVLEAVARHRALPGVAAAQPDFVYHPDLVPDDPLYVRQAAFTHRFTQAELGWDLETGDPDVVIAIVGLGVDVDHPDLAPNAWINPGEIPNNGVDDDRNGFVDDRSGWDFHEGDADPQPDPDWPHETEVAGVAAARGNNAEGVAGVCWQCRIMALRTGLDFTTSEALAPALDYARENGAAVVNMSFGSYSPDRLGPDTVVEEAVDAAYEQGIVLVATAGNAMIGVRRYPAALENVIATAASDDRDTRHQTSNFGPWVSLAAPGKAALTTTGEGGYRGRSGTSFAAPYVAGVAGLLFAAHPDLSPTRVRRRIEYGVDRIVTDLLIGSGRINVFRTLGFESDPDLFAVIKAPLARAIVGDRVTVSGTALGEEYWLEYRAAGDPTWTQFGTGGEVVDGELGVLELGDGPTGFYELRLTATHTGRVADDRVTIYRDPSVPRRWPVFVGGGIRSSPVYADVDKNGKPEVFASFDSGAEPAGVAAYQRDGRRLRGWPVSDPDNFFMSGSASVGDLDGDGDGEIVQATATTRRVFAWHRDGRIVEGWPRELAEGIWPVASTVLADLTHDGLPDVICGASDGTVHAWRGDGVEIAGWPVAVGAGLSTAPAVGDLDGDGDPEVVVHGPHAVHAFHHDGSSLEGWPVALDSAENPPVLADLDADGADEVLVVFERFPCCGDNEAVVALGGDGAERWSTDLPESGFRPGTSLSNPALGDADGDGLPEYCIGGNRGNLHLVDDAGGLVAGWPVRVPANVHACAMADVDADGLQELLAGAEDGLVYAWNADGTLVPGWPRSAQASVGRSTPVVGDLDRDGCMDVVVGNETGDLVIHRLDVALAPGSAHWPMFQGNPRHDGRFAAQPVPDPMPGAGRPPLHAALGRQCR